MKLPALIFDKSIKFAIGSVSRPPYANSPDDFRNNPDECFKKFFLHERRIAAEDLVSQISDFGPFLESVIKTDAAGYDEEFIFSSNLSVENFAIGAMLHKVVRLGYDFNPDAHLIAIAYGMFLKEEGYDEFLDDLLDKVRLSKSWEKNLLIVILWYSDTNGFRNEIMKQFEETEKALHYSDKTTINRNLSLVENCVVFLADEIVKFSSDGNPTVLFSSYLFDRSAVGKSLTNLYPNFQPILEAIDNSNSQFLETILYGATGLDINEKFQEMLAIWRKEVVDLLPAFIDNHDDLMKNFDYYVYYTVTIIFFAFFNGTLDKIEDSSKDLLDTIDEYVSQKQASDLILAFSEFAGEEVLGLARLKLYCIALWYANQNNFQQLVTDLAADIKAKMPQNNDNSDQNNNNSSIGKNNNTSPVAPVINPSSNTTLQPQNPAPARKGINLSKGQRVTLDNSMKMALIDLGWDTNQYDGGFDFDLDASVFLLGSNGKCARDEDFIFYGNLSSRNGAVVHQGDNRVGGGDGENIIIDFTKIPADITRLAICVSIDAAAERRQNFGQVRNAYIRIAKIASEFDLNGEDQLRFDLEEEFSIETAIVVCEIYKKDGIWKFNAVGSGFQGGLASLVTNYGLQVE